MTIDLEHRLRSAVDDAFRVADDVPAEPLLMRITRRRAGVRVLVPTVAVASAAAALAAVVFAQSPGGPPTPEIAPPPVAEQPPSEDPPSTDDDVEPEADGDTTGSAHEEDGIEEVGDAAGGCSAAGLTSEVSTQPVLPAAVAELRSELAARAVACDLDGLGALAAPDGFTYSYGGDGDPAGYWSRVEGSGEEPAPIEALRLVLEAPPGRYEPVSAGDSTYWVWPRLAALHVEQTDEVDLRAAIDEVVATGVHPRELVDEMVREHGGYIGYRVFIEVPADGSAPRWTAFVAGD